MADPLEQELIARGLLARAQAKKPKGTPIRDMSADAHRRRMNSPNPNLGAQEQAIKDVSKAHKMLVNETTDPDSNFNGKTYSPEQIQQMVGDFWGNRDSVSDGDITPNAALIEALFQRYQNRFPGKTLDQLDESEINALYEYDMRDERQ